MLKCHLLTNFYYDAECNPKGVILRVYSNFAGNINNTLNTFLDENKI